jgi:hypothetical protein
MRENPNSTASSTTSPRWKPIQAEAEAELEMLSAESAIQHDGIRFQPDAVRQASDLASRVRAKSRKTREQT